MSNLRNIPKEINPEVIEDLMEMMESDEIEHLADYEEWMESQILGQTIMPFIKKRVNRRKYKKGKVIFTKSRIAGVVLHLLESSKGSPCYATCKRVMDYTGFSERTVRTYLYDVLDWLVRNEKLVLQIDEKRGYLVCTQAHLDLEKSHGDALEPKKFASSPWLKKSQLPFAALLKKCGFTPPPAKNCPHTLKVDLHPSFNKENLNKRVRKLPVKLAGIARNLLLKTPLQKFAKIELSEKVEHRIAWELLSDGYWRKDVIWIMDKALFITNSAIVELNVRNKTAYLRGMIDRIKAGVMKPTSAQIRSARHKFWGEQKGDFIALMKEANQKIAPAILSQFDTKLAESA